MVSPGVRDFGRPRVLFIITNLSGCSCPGFIVLLRRCQPSYKIERCPTVCRRQLLVAVLHEEYSGRLQPFVASLRREVKKMEPHRIILHCIAYRKGKPPKKKECAPFFGTVPLVFPPKTVEKQGGMLAFFSISSVAKLVVVSSILASFSLPGTPLEPPGARLGAVAFRIQKKVPKMVWTWSGFWLVF